MAAGREGAALAPVLGRRAELGLLEKRVGLAARGHGGVVILKGPPGIGKSRLAAAAVAFSRDQGMSVVSDSAECYEHGRPCAPLLNAFPGSAVPPPKGVVDRRTWLVDQLRAELEDRALRAPVLMVLDDLESADSDTLLALARLTSELAAYPLLWLFAYDDQPSQGIHRVIPFLERLPDAARIEVGALGRRAVGEVASDVVGGRPDAELLSALSTAEGNPFLVRELILLLVRTERIRLDEGRACLLSPPRPAEVSSLASARLAGLSPEARRLLEVCAVLGSRLSVDEVGDVLGEAVGQLLIPLRAVLDAEILIAVDDALAFSHKLIRQAVYDGIPEPVRIALHQEIGGILLQRGRSAANAATHLLRGVQPGDRRVLAALEQASAELLSEAPHAAAFFAVRALDLTGTSDENRFARTASAVDALVLAGRLGDATEVAHRVLDDPVAPALVTAELRLRVSSIWLMRGRTASALAEAEGVIAQPDLPEPLYVSAELSRLLGCIAQDDSDRIRALAEAILAGGDRPGADAALSAALTALAFVAWKDGRVADAVGMLRAAVHRSDLAPPEGRRHYARLGLAKMLIAVGELAEADTVIDECRQEIERLGDSMWTAGPNLSRSRLHVAAGRLDDAVAEAHVGLAIAEELGTHCFVPLLLSVLASIAVLRCDLDQAEQHFEHFRNELPLSWPDALDSAAFRVIGASIVEARHGATAAVEMLADFYDDLPAHRRVLLDGSASGAWLVRVAVAAGDRARAEAAVRCADQLAVDNAGFPSIVEAATHARGVFERDLDALTTVAGGHRYPWARASAMEDAGALLAEGSDRPAAARQLEAALVTYEESGADRDAARVRVRLAALVNRRRCRVVRPVTGWLSLTKTEEAVATQVTEGLTNRQVAERLYLSRHTVDFHLRQIFRKLDIGSRVDLTRLALERRQESARQSSR